VRSFRPKSRLLQRQPDLDGGQPAARYLPDPVGTQPSIQADGLYGCWWSPMLIPGQTYDKDVALLLSEIDPLQKPGRHRRANPASATRWCERPNR